ncbi:MAG: competence protein CoiA family protein [Verrucomicrobiae bacterium]
MLSAVRVRDKCEVLAPDESRGLEVYRCPDCESTVVLKKCRLKIDHFAHKPPITCTYGSGESETHRRCKLGLFRALQTRPEVTHLKLERSLKTIRPDVSFRLGELRVAIEVQISSLTLETIIRRTEEYAKRGIALIWLAQWSDKVIASKYTPLSWEKWVHAAQFGRIYYWKEGLTVIPIHFGEHYLWQDGSEWYTPEGEHKSVGYYWKNSKRFVKPIKGRELNLLDDFVCKPREEWIGKGRFPIPAYKLWFDKRIYSWAKIPKPISPPDSSSEPAKAN